MSSADDAHRRTGRVGRPRRLRGAVREARERSPGRSASPAFPCSPELRGGTESRRIAAWARRPAEQAPSAGRARRARPVAYERLERSQVPGCADHRVGLDPSAAGAQRRPSRHRHGGGDLDPSFLDRLDDRGVDDRGDLALRSHGREHARLGLCQAVLAEVPEVRAGAPARDPVGDPGRQPPEPGGDQVARTARPLAQQDVGGVRTASQTFAAPPSASSWAISIPELPGPTMSTRLPTNELGCGSRRSGVARPGRSRPGQSGTTGAWSTPVATITCGARTSPALVWTTQPSSRCSIRSTLVPRRSSSPSSAA